MEAKTPKEQAKQMYDHYCDNLNIDISHNEIIKECIYLCNQKIFEAYKIDNRYLKDYYNFWHSVLSEFTND